MEKRSWFSKWPFTLAATLLFAFQVKAQITIKVIEVPPNTPKEDTLFLVGNFNNWKVHDLNYQLIRQPDGTREVTFESDLDYIEYKFNRGNWLKVEGGEKGQAISNRALFNNKQGPVTVEAKIKSWEDKEAFKLHVTEVPPNTPHDASIYITGNFNDWDPSDEQYKLQLNEHGDYVITISTELDTLVYKFTRGNWSSVEGYGSGRPKGNRVFYRGEAESQTIENTIEAWEDLSGSAYNIFTFLFALGVLQAFLIIMALWAKKRENREANYFMITWLAAIIVALGIKIILFNRDVFNWQPKLILVPDFAAFLLAPLLYFYFKKLLYPKEPIGVGGLVHLIPFGLHFIVYLPLFLIESQKFVLNVLNQQFNTLYFIVFGVALVYNIRYWFKLIGMIMKRESREDTSQEKTTALTGYLNSLLILLAITLFICLAAYLIAVSGVFRDSGYSWLVVNMVDFAWISLALNTYLISYFALNNPSLFNKEDQVEKYRISQINKDMSTHLKSELAGLMNKQKPYLNPKLTLQQLADMMKTNTHTLSRVINEGYSRNFFDFVNLYRIEEFKVRINQEAHKNQTFLAIAYDVGFSSKTTFNRAFKKITEKTPREYLNCLKDKMHANTETP